MSEYVDREAGARAAHIIRQHLTDLDRDTVRTSTVAIRLADGGSDGVVYDNRRDAVRHQARPDDCVYLRLRDFLLRCDAPMLTMIIAYRRIARDRGMPNADRDHRTGGPELINPLTRADMLTQARLLVAQRRI